MLLRECIDGKLLLSLSNVEVRLLLSLSEEEARLLLSLSDGGLGGTTCFPAIKQTKMR